jgi:transposase
LPCYDFPLFSVIIFVSKHLQGSPVYSDAHIQRFYYQGVDAVIRVVHRLEDQLEDARAQLIRQPQPLIASLSKELQATKRTLGHKSDELIKERQLNHQLCRRLHELERELESGTSRVGRDSHNSSLPPSLDLPWKKVQRTRSLRRKSGRLVGGQRGHQGATLRQVAQPNQFILHTPDVCQDCAAPLHNRQPVAVIRRQVFDISDGRVKVTEHKAEARRCKECGATTRAAFPASVRAPVQYGQGVLSRSCYLHLYQLLPVARTSETMRDLFGCAISPATVQRAARLSAGKLVHTELRIKAALRDSSIMGVDETGLRVAGSNGYIHVARTEQLTHYAYDERRGKAAMDEIGILPQFRGTLVRDGFSSYQWYGQCRHSLCNAHLLRDLVFVAEVCPEQEVWTKPLSKLLLKIKRKVVLPKTQPEVELTQRVKTDFLRRYDRLVRRADRLNPPPPKGTVTSDASKNKSLQRPTPGSLIKRLQRRRDEVLRFMSDLSVPFDNNGSERDLRMVKLQQKISGCFRTPDGARSFCRVRSYLSTSRKQGHSLLYALERALVGKPLPILNTELPSAT